MKYSTDFHKIPVLAVLAALSSMAASADTIAPSQLYVADGSFITEYSLMNTPPIAATDFFTQPAGQKVIGMVFTPSGTLLTAASHAAWTIGSGSGVIYSISRTGQETQLAQVSSVQGIALDASGDIFAGGNGGQEIDELTSSGAAAAGWTPITNNITTVDSLIFDSKGDLFEGDGTKGVNEYSSTGAFLANYSVGGTGLYGMAFDAAGDLYVGYANPGKNKSGIEEFSPTGALITSSFYTSTANSSGHVPVGLAYDPNSGTLYMSYTVGLNGTSGGIAYFAAGAGGTVTATDSPLALTNSTIASPYGIAVLTPEPGTWLMFATGLLAISLFRVRRVRQ